MSTCYGKAVLADPSWERELTPEDLRALTPLIYGHVNPYGTYHLDMDARLALITSASKIGVGSGASRWPFGVVSCASFLPG